MFNENANKLRKLMAEKELVVGVGARDALDAKLIENAGFDFVWSSSLGVSASYAIPDASLISMKQYIEAARSMAEVIDIPIIIDADTGYGNANNVMYAVRQFEAAGLAAMSMEDKKFPKDNSLLAGGRQELARIEEFCGKIKAAKDTQKSEDFIVIARVEALIAGWGQQEAIKRATAYVDAGADSILIHSKSKSPDEVVEFVKAWDGRAPITLVPTMYPDLTEEKIKELGKVKIVIYANHTFRAAVKATEEIQQKIKRAKSIHTINDMMVPVARLFELQGVPQMKENEKKYLL
ncbi:MAG: isocitrate lyase/phosphoenolpyruvate mutase family protein [Planctomycetota bacterium]|jgi:phosphonopyruvate hydrolase